VRRGRPDAVPPALKKGWWQLPAQLDMLWDTRQEGSGEVRH